MDSIHFILSTPEDIVEHHKYERGDLLLVSYIESPYLFLYIYRSSPTTYSVYGCHDAKGICTLLKESETIVDILDHLVAFFSDKVIDDGLARRAFPGFRITTVCQYEKEHFENGNKRGVGEPLFFTYLGQGESIYIYYNNGMYSHRYRFCSQEEDSPVKESSELSVILEYIRVTHGPHPRLLRQASKD